MKNKPVLLLAQLSGFFEMEHTARDVRNYEFLQILNHMYENPLLQQIRPVKFYFISGIQQFSEIYYKHLLNKLR
jgi:hypothetical protein